MVSTDSTGNAATVPATPLSFYSPASADTDPPVFTVAPKLSGKTDTTATLHWEADEPAGSQVHLVAGAVATGTGAAEGQTEPPRQAAPVTELP